MAEKHLIVIKLLMNISSDEIMRNHMSMSELLTPQRHLVMIEPLTILPPMKNSFFPQLHGDVRRVGDEKPDVRLVDSAAVWS